MKVLLIRLRLVGDVVFVTPAIRALARRIPGLRLTVLVEALAAPILTTNPHVHDVIIARRSRGLARLRDDLTLGRKLRAARFDTVIDFQGGPRAAWLTWASRARVRIGYATRGRGWVYTRLVARPTRPRHAVENQWDLLAALGDPFANPPDPYDDPVEMPEDPAAVARVTRRLAAARIGHEHQVVVLHVSAGNRFRRWPEECFVDLASSLAAADETRRLVVVSGPSDAAAAARVRDAARARLGARAEAMVDGNELDLAELRALVARAALFIGGDSGPLHVAATTRVPVVGIYGPTQPIRSAPWRDPACITESVDIGELPCRPCDQRHCEPGDFRCLTHLKPDAVIAAAERALARAYDQRHHDRRPANGAAAQA